MRAHEGVAYFTQRTAQHSTGIATASKPDQSRESLRMCSKSGHVLTICTHHKDVSDMQSCLDH